MRYIQLIGLLLLTACGDGGTTPTSLPTPVAKSITLSLTSLSFSSLGETSQLTATVKDQNGNDISGTTATWTTADASVATISSTGLITAVAEGTVVVSVTLGTLSAEVDVTVLQVPVSLELAEEVLNFELLGASVQLTAGAKDGNGYAISDTMISWVTSNQSVATVSGSGVVTTVNGGSAEITVTVT